MGPSKMEGALKEQLYHHLTQVTVSAFLSIEVKKNLPSILTVNVSIYCRTVRRLSGRTKCVRQARKRLHCQYNTNDQAPPPLLFFHDNN